MLQTYIAGATAYSSNSSHEFVPVVLKTGNMIGTVETKDSKEESKKTVDSKENFH